MNNKQEITSRGLAQQSGLDIFCSITNYTGEFISMGNPLITSNVDSAADAEAIAASDPQLDVVSTLFPSTQNIWYIRINCRQEVFHRNDKSLSNC